MTNYNKLTKAQLIELLEKKDEKFNKLLHRAKEIIKSKNDEIKTLKDKYENITLEKFIDNGLLLATESTTEKIHNKWYERTGENVRFDTINEIIESKGIDITPIKRRIYDNKYTHLYQDKSHNSKINLNPEGFIYINQLVNDIAENIFKPGKAKDPMSRYNLYYNVFKQLIHLLDLFWVPNRRLCERLILNKIIDMGYAPIIRECGKDKDNENTNEFFKIEYEILHKIVVETVKECGGFQVDISNVIKNHTKGRFINKQILSE